MLKNKELKKLIKVEIGLFLISLFVIFFFYQIIDIQYKKEFIKNNGYMISAILNEHPELEEELMNSILSGKGDFEKGKTILQKYGLDQIETLDYLEQFHTLKLKVLIKLMIVITLIFLIITISYYRFLKLQYQQLNKLGEYMDQVLNGNDTLSIKDYEEGYFSTLKNDVYKLTTKLKEGRNRSIQDKKELEQVLSDISHQIKTPLTSMYVINDLLKKEDIDKTTKEQFLEKNKIQLERIEWLVTTLLKMSRLDSGSVQLHLEETSIQTIISKSLDPLLIPIELKNITVEIKNKNNILVLLDAHWTIEVFVNILKNAYEHTPISGKITISMSENPIYTEVSIHNTGSGIKKDELPFIFDRFYTGSGNKESIGVGLNMAKKIMEKQNGEIYATSIEEEGTTFFLKFYKTVK